MNSFTKSFLLLMMLVVFISSCKKDPETITGCTDPLGDTFNAQATVDNGSCTFQKRFLGNYTGEFVCKGLFAAVFNMADVSITELIKKDEVNIIITTTIGPLPVLGKLTKNEINVDAVLPNLTIKAKDVFPTAGDETILVDGKILTVLTISADNKKLTGDLKLTLILKETTLISGIPFPAGTSLSDECAFVGTRK